MQFMAVVEQALLAKTGKIDLAHAQQLGRLLLLARVRRQRRQRAQHEHPDLRAAAGSQAGAKLGQALAGAPRQTCQTDS